MGFCGRGADLLRSPKNIEIIQGLPQWGIPKKGQGSGPPLSSRVSRALPNVTRRSIQGSPGVASTTHGTRPLPQGHIMTVGLKPRCYAPHRGDGGEINYTDAPTREAYHNGAPRGGMRARHRAGEQGPLGVGCKILAGGQSEWAQNDQERKPSGDTSGALPADSSACSPYRSSDFEVVAVGSCWS